MSEEQEKTQEVPQTQEELHSSDSSEPRKGFMQVFHAILKKEPKLGNCACGTENCICTEVFPWVVFVAISLASGWVGSLFMQPDGFTWFNSLVRPACAPPQWVFLPVWIVLYFLLGTSVWISHRTVGCRNASGIVGLFALLLFMQIGWNYSFFYVQNPFGAFINLLGVFLVLLLLGLASLRVSRVAAYLLLPEIMWLMYALVLNFQIWRLN